MPIVATGAIILKDKKILLAKRTAYTKAYPHYWNCPGGKANPGETPEQAIVREVKEEVGLDFTPTRLFEKRHFKTPDGPAVVIGYQFLGTWQGELKLCKIEIADCKWFTYGEAVKLELAFNYRDILEKLRREGLL